MRLLMFAIYDSAAGYYQDPFTARADGEVLRDLGRMAQDPKAGQLHLHPSDFTLFKIGEYDNNTGVVQMYEAKQNLGTVLEIRSRVQREQQRLQSAPEQQA